MKISFQGELGSYSHQACCEVFHKPTAVPCPTFQEAMNLVKSGKSDLALLPVENSTYGRVADMYHLLPGSGLYIVQEHFLRVHINLLALPGSKLSDIKSAISHTVLLGQCQKFLSEHSIVGIPSADTAGSAKLVAAQKDTSLAALASPLAGKIYGLEPISSKIEDMSNNTTRFLIMGNSLEKDILKKTDEKFMTTIIFQVKNIPAALYKAMGGFATNGVNMVKLESYMVAGSFRSTQFYADIEGSPDEEPVARALEELKFYTSMLKILGVYKCNQFRFTD